MAALALLFGMHHYRPAPFLIMDEIDAALDNVNVHKVASYLSRRTGAGGGVGDLQAIIVSLKDTFYERAGGLVGVYRECDLSSSRALSLDLTKISAPA